MASDGVRESPPRMARAHHNDDLVRHGICPMCFRLTQKCGNGVCKRCAPKLVTLRSPCDAERCGLTPFLGNLFLRDEVCALENPPPLYKGESHVASNHLQAVEEHFPDDVDE